jgi:hypothetical protein
MLTPSNSTEATTVVEQTAPDEWICEFLIDEETEEARIGFIFRTRLGRTRFVDLDTDLAESPKDLRLALKRHGAALTGTIAQQLTFVENLVKNAAEEGKLLTSKPGFRDDTFVLGPKAFGRHKEKYRWKRNPDDPRVDRIGEVAGTLITWKRDVGGVAVYSSYLSFALMASLATCLPSYFRWRTGKPLLPEAPVFNFSGETSIGKTTITLAGAGLFGAPDVIFAWDFTERGLAEICHARNDLLLVLDDTEKYIGKASDFEKALRLVNQLIPGGQSKLMARVARKNSLPALTWAVTVLTSSERPINILAAECGMKRTRGNNVRLIDIAVPGASKGGIFDRLPETGNERLLRARDLIGQLKSGIETNYGLLFPLWISVLLEADRTAELDSYIKFFMAKARTHVGWEDRNALKFAVVFAAGKLATKAGLLPLPKDLAWKATRCCYWRALAALASDEDRAVSAIRELVKLSDDHDAFARSGLGSWFPISFKEETMGVLCKYKGKDVVAVRAERLSKIAGGNAVKKMVLARLAKAKALFEGQGHANTLQLPLRIRIGGKMVKKPRFYVISLAALRQLADAA